MKSKTQKSKELKDLQDKLPKSKITVFTSFSPSTHSTSSGRASSGQAKTGEKGLSVAQMTELKRLLRSMKSEYFVTKKTLIDLALRPIRQSLRVGLRVSLSRTLSLSNPQAQGKQQYDGLDIYGMEGSVGLVLGEDDPYAVAKKVYEFSRKNPALHFWGALMDGKFVGKDGFLEIAKMPSKEVLIGRLLGMLTYPMRGLAVALAEVAKKRATS